MRAKDVKRPKKNRDDNSHIGVKIRRQSRGNAEKYRQKQTEE